MKYTDYDIKVVVLTIFSLQGGGAERFVLTLAQGFKKLGYEPHIICFKSQVDYERPDIPLHFLPYQSYRWMPKIIRNKVFAKVFDNYVKNNISNTQALVISNLWQVDQVLTHSKLPNKIFVIHNTLSKERHIHTYITDKALQRVYAKQNIVAVSEGAKEDFEKIVKDSRSLTAIHNPIDKKSIIESAQEVSVWRQLQSKHPVLDKGYIIHVGKFKIQKNHADLIKAYAKSNQSKALLLVGQGELKEECEQLCKKLCVQDKVVFAGFEPNPYPLIVHAEAMVLCSTYEGFGIVIAEALALGVPVISTDCESGPSELLPTDNLVAVGDIDGLAAKLDEIMIKPKTFESSFDLGLLPDAVAKRYLDALKVKSDFGLYST